MSAYNKSDWLVILTYMSLLHESVVLPIKGVATAVVLCYNELFQEVLHKVGSSTLLRLCDGGLNG